MARSEVPAHGKPRCAAYRDNPYYLRTTPVDEFEPKGYGLHNVSGHFWEWLVVEPNPLQPLLAAQSRPNKGVGFLDSAGVRMTAGSFPVPQRSPISSGNLGGRSPPCWALKTCTPFEYPNKEERVANGDAIGT
jgi:hypothetical protein